MLAQVCRQKAVRSVVWMKRKRICSGPDTGTITVPSLSTGLPTVGVATGRPQSFVVRSTWPSGKTNSGVPLQTGAWRNNKIVRRIGKIKGFGLAEQNFEAENLMRKSRSFRQAHDFKGAAYLQPWDRQRCACKAQLWYAGAHAPARPGIFFTTLLLALTFGCQYFHVACPNFGDIVRDAFFVRVASGAEFPFDV